ncbi:hypothetical protein BJX61DRAFT_549434 [Aspergillus egyptiacus]|nr:hypothetical protein BJX61DRAFT_549434 [Aspergillus egyptiacus]
MSHHDAEGISSKDWPDLTDSPGRAGQKLRKSLHTGVRVMDGRLDIKLSNHKAWLQQIIDHTRRHPYPPRPAQQRQPPPAPSVSTTQEGPREQDGSRFPLRLNIVIQVVGSRGDVQPFLAIGKQLRSDGHRVRLATHLAFREMVEKEDLEFFNVGGDPAELMAFMVKNPGLMPDMGSIRQGTIRKRRREMKEIFSGCWRSCYETGDGTGIGHHIAPDPWSGEADYRNTPFVADVIIANPPSFAHISCAEKLGVPLNMMFTMPWSATQAVPHPLANIRSKNTKPSVANFASYPIVEIIMWEGLGDLINRFRKRELGLDQLDAIRAPSIAHRLQIPFTYLWSPALLEKPFDWDSHIDVAGFSMLPRAQDYEPPEDLKRFLDDGPPPVYVGFGSIVVDDPSSLTKIVFDAVRQTGQRAVISKGWGNIGAEQSDTPEIMMIDKCPHDWLFQHVSCVVHHGGAGTTAAGLALGKPTVIVPFFGDQTFWGSVVARAGAGPEPMPYKELTTEKLVAAINKALEEDTRKNAGEIGESMRAEQGAQSAVRSLYSHLDVESLRCSLCPDRPAVWLVRRSRIRLSAFAATVLVETGLLKPSDLILYRSKEYDTSRDPRGPLSAGAEVLYGLVTDFIAGMHEIPADMAEDFREHQHRRHSPNHLQHGQRGPSPGRAWKKEHYAQRSPESDIASSDETQSDEREEDEEEEEEESAGNALQSRASIASSELSYASAKEDPEADDAGSTISKTPTQDDIANELKKLNQSDTLRRQRTHDKSQHDFRGILTDARYHVTRTGQHILDWALLLPTDLTLSFSKGFHNAPKLYHDPMVRETPTVRGMRGGLRAAGTEFTEEFYQGVTGLVTQPIHGQKESGTKGMLKGVGKGVGGFVLKPVAGIWGLAGYPLDGLHKSIRTSLAKAKIRDILSGRIAQGLGEMAAASREERSAVIHRWKETQKSKSEANGHA